MTDFTLERIAIPAHLDDPDEADFIGADFIGADFIATVEVRNATEADGYGTEELSAPPPNCCRSGSTRSTNRSSCLRLE